MGDPNCTFYDEAIPYDAAIPYDGICTAVAVTNRPIYWVGKRSTWEKEKEDKKRKQQRLVVSITSEVFSVNDINYHKNEPNQIRVSETLDPVDVAVTKLVSHNPQPQINIQSNIHQDNIQLVPIVTTDINDIINLNSEVYPEIEAENVSEDNNTEVLVNSEILDEINVVCELVENEKNDLIIKEEPNNDNRNGNQ